MRDYRTGRRQRRQVRSTFAAEAVATPPEVVEQTDRESARAELRALLEILKLEVTAPLFAVASFAGTYVFNSLIFGRWGVRFSQIATAGDVLMNGMQLFTMATVAFVLATAVVIAITYPKSAILRVAAFLVVVGVCGYIAKAHGEYDPYRANPLFDDVFLLIVSWIVVFAATGSIIASFRGEILKIRSMWWREGLDIFLISASGLSISVALIFLVMAAGVAIENISRFGYQDDPLFTESRHCQRPVAQVMWMGERARVLRCEKDYLIENLEDGATYMAHPPKKRPAPASHRRLESSETPAATTQ